MRGGVQYRQVRFPYKGLHVGRSFIGQPEDTTVDCQNVRAWDPVTGRSIGAQRHGLTRYLNAQAGASTGRIQDISHIVQVPSSVTLTQAQLQSRTVQGLCVKGGTVYEFDDTSFTAVAGGPHFQANAPVVFSARYGEDLYYADGTNEKFYDSSAGTVSAWTPSSGSFPVSGSNRPRLIELWRGRLVLSGLRGDERNWFMTRQDDPLDFNYGISPPDVQQAVAGNNSEAGEVGDVVNAICPYDDDTLIWFCDHSIWQMTGDPAEGGRNDEISDITGGAFGRPYCKTAGGAVYFVGSRGGFYRMAAGGKPERLSSNRVEEKFANIDLDTNIVRLVYDDRTQGVQIFITPLTAGDTTHYHYDIRNDAFWPDKYADSNFNPVAVHIYDGDSVDDRVILIGSEDGRIRYFDYDNFQDDTEPISSHVWIGPMQLEEQREATLLELHGVLNTDSFPVNYEAYAGPSPQQAYNEGQLFFRGQWKPGRNWSDDRRALGHAIFLKLLNERSNEHWQFDHLFARLVSTGLSGHRGKH